MSMFDGPITLQPAADFHVHLRDGEMMELVTPTIRMGGVNTAYVMPNLVPPITSVAQALAYRSQLEALAPDVRFLMTLYLSPEITPAVIAEAAASGGITGVKVYPAGVTTNSAAGVVSLEPFYPVFEAMQAHDMVLNLHGEVPSTSSISSAEAYATPGAAATVLTAEPLFLPTLHALHAAFPRLRIVLEHCTTAAAVAAVAACGPNVAGTLTAHHLFLTTDDVVADSLNFCKPVAKTPADRVALLRAAFGQGGSNSSDKFFFGSDSAPHPAHRKRPGVDDESPASAGCFTQPWVVQLVVAAAEEAARRGWLGAEDVTAARLDEFLSRRGRRFYKLPEQKASGDGEGNGRGRAIVLEKKGEKVAKTLVRPDRPSGVQVVPFRRGEETWSLRWE